MSNTTGNKEERVRHRLQLPPYARAKRVSRHLYATAKESLVDICGIADCILDGGFHGTPMCEEHAWEVWAILDALKDYQVTRERAKKHMLEREEALNREARKKAVNLAETWKSQRWIEPGWIYYLHVGGIVKIGYTTDLERRMKQYPPHSSLLAVHPGTPKLEREMHHKFLHLLANGREWFKVADDLTNHITDVRARFKDHPVESMEILKPAA